MRKILLTMLGFYLIVFRFGVLFYDFLFPMVEDSYLYPIYFGMILLSGLIVGCTKLILEEIRMTKDSKAKADNIKQISKYDNSQNSDQEEL